MKNLENMKALYDMELAKVAGGDNNASILDMFRDWMIRLSPEVPVKGAYRRGKC